MNCISKQRYFCLPALFRILSLGMVGLLGMGCVNLLPTNKDIYQESSNTISTYVPEEWDPPTLASPQNGNTVCVARPLLDWKGNPEEIYSYVTISYYDSLKDPLISTQWSYPPYQVSFELPNGTYYWVVNSFKETGTSSRSEMWMFEVDLIEEPFSLGIKEGNETCSTQPTFTWKQGSNNRVSTYDLHVFRDEEYKIHAFDTQVSKESQQYIPQDELSIGYYYWRMRGISDQNCNGAWIHGPRLQVKPAGSCY
jgi:hypothetical protein